MVHYGEIFDFELELLTPLWQAVLGSHCSTTGHTARQWFTLLGDRSRCSVTGHAARQRFTLLSDGSRCSTIQHGGWTMSLTARRYSHLLGRAQDDVAQRVQGAWGLAVPQGWPSPQDEALRGMTLLGTSLKTPGRYPKVTTRFVRICMIPRFL